MDSIEAYPLTWPSHVPRAKARERASFGQRTASALAQPGMGAGPGGAGGRVIAVPIGEGRANIPGLGRCKVYCEVVLSGPMQGSAGPGGLQNGDPILKTRRVVELPDGRRFATPWDMHVEAL